MKKTILLFSSLVVFSFGVKAQYKQDGTPDMRYKANKEMYGNSYSSPSYSSPSYSSPSYSQPSEDRNYNNGGQYRLQEGYTRSNGTYVQPHYKTTPDNNTWNNIR